MKIIRSISIVLAIALGVFASAARADNQKATPSAAGQLVPVTDHTDATWLAKARADYPLDTCSVSGDKLEGDMGGPKDFVYKVSGQPDRLVRFCCKSCLKDFNKEPAKYLKVIDDAAAEKAKSRP